MVYNFGLTLYVWLIRLVAPRHPKAQLWIDGRKDSINAWPRPSTRQTASSGCTSRRSANSNRASHHRTHPQDPSRIQILLTFFSPSGYEVRKNYQGVDYIFYLPIDTPRQRPPVPRCGASRNRNLRKIRILAQPAARPAPPQGAHLYLSAIFRRNSIFFRPYGGMWRQALESFDVMFVQNEESKKLLAGWASTT